MDLEAQRLQNLQQKHKLLADLKLDSHRAKIRGNNPPETTRPNKRRKLDHQSLPARASARIASSTSRPSYAEDRTQTANYLERPHRPQVKKSIKNDDEESTKDERLLVPTADSEQIRIGWSSWKPVASLPRRADSGTLHFKDFPHFTPNKTPEEVIREGCFGGSYFRPLKSRKLGILVQGDWTELPKNWYQGLDRQKYMTSPDYDADVNKFKVACGQSIEEWEANGWIAFAYDIRGWFQWYCRFYQGRRCEDDDRQVSRWRKCVGETGRWRRTLLKKYVLMGVREVFDDGEEEEAVEVSPVIHQTCHHWAYEVRQDDLDEAWAAAGR